MVPPEALADPVGPLPDAAANRALRQEHTAEGTAGPADPQNLLSVPVILGTERVGRITVISANSAYTDRDVRAAGRVAELAALAVQRHRAEQALADSNRQLGLALARARDLAVAAEQAIRLKTEFLANTSHELRTPLTGIIGSLSIVLERLCDSPEEEEKFIHIGFTAAHNLLRLVNDLLDLWRREPEAAYAWRVYELSGPSFSNRTPLVDTLDRRERLPGAAVPAGGSRYFAVAARNDCGDESP